MTVDPALTALARLAIGLLFAHAAWHKCADFARFRGILASYRLLPERLGLLAAVVVVAAELMVSAGALVGLNASLFGAAALLALYGGAIAVNLVRHRALLDCGCGGPAQPISWWLVLRNGVLLLIALVGLLPAETRSLQGFDYLTISGGLIAGAALYAAANTLHAARAELEEWV